MLPATSTIIHADITAGLDQLPTGSVHCCVTSPPYYGLRSYGIEPREWADGSRCVLGDEDTVARYVEHLVEVFEPLKRVLHPRGSFWLNLGDCYAQGGRHVETTKFYNIPADGKPSRARQKGMSKRNLLLVPARAALALQAAGWILVQDNIWAKALSFCSHSGSIKPESVRHRTTWAHEHVFHFTLRDDAFYDQDGCREPYADSTLRQLRQPYRGQGTKDYATAGAENPSDVKRRILDAVADGGGRNLRNVWVIGKANYPGAHFATFPTKLVEPVVKLATSAEGCCARCLAPVVRRTIREAAPDTIQAAFNAARVVTAAATGRTDGHTMRRPNYRRRVLRTEWEASCACENAPRQPMTVLDPFCGSGSAGVVAAALGRSFIGIDASEVYCETARGRTTRLAESSDAQPGA